MAIDLQEIRSRAAEKLGQLLSKVEDSDRVGEMERCIELLEGAGCSFSFFKPFVSMTPIEFGEYVFVDHIDILAILQNTHMLHPGAIESAFGADTLEEFVLRLLPSDGHLE